MNHRFLKVDSKLGMKALERFFRYHLEKLVLKCINKTSMRKVRTDKFLTEHYLCVFLGKLNIEARDCRPLPLAE